VNAVLPPGTSRGRRAGDATSRSSSTPPRSSGSTSWAHPRAARSPVRSPRPIPGGFAAPPSSGAPWASRGRGRRRSGPGSTRGGARWPWPRGATSRRRPNASSSRSPSCRRPSRSFESGTRSPAPTAAA
jgi:hypothetical protein